MWWHYQNLESPRKTKDGTLWHFRLWHDHIQGIYTQRIYFWDEKRKVTGLLELSDDQTIHISKLKHRMTKIMSDADYRRKFLMPLQFPVERNY